MTFEPKLMVKIFARIFNIKSPYQRNKIHVIRVLNAEEERNSKIKTNLVYFIYLFTINLFRMPGEACHTLQVIVASDSNA